jgi:UTP--glucose-1-phosphate uridylyltransferase
MLLLVDKPIIQYGVEEAVGAGISNIILVTGRARTRSRITSTCRSNSRRFSRLAASATSSPNRKISNLINFGAVVGRSAGLGHAVLVTRELVADEPFAVILADDVIDAEPPAIGS